MDIIKFTDDYNKKTKYIHKLINKFYIDQNKNFRRNQFVSPSEANTFHRERKRLQLFNTGDKERTFHWLVTSKSWKIFVFLFDQQKTFHSFGLGFLAGIGSASCEFESSENSRGFSTKSVISVPLVENPEKYKMVTFRDRWFYNGNVYII